MTMIEEMPQYWPLRTSRNMTSNLVRLTPLSPIINKNNMPATFLNLVKQGIFDSIRSKFPNSKNEYQCPITKHRLLAEWEVKRKTSLFWCPALRPCGKGPPAVGSCTYERHQSSVHQKSHHQPATDDGFLRAPLIHSPYGRARCPHLMYFNPDTRETRMSAAKTDARARVGAIEHVIAYCHW